MISKVVVEADGGSRGNPGPAGYGAVVRDPDTGDVLAERQDGLGVATNNVAEYTGLIAGLEAAVELGASTVEARLDSKLVVEQMSGRWKIKNAALQPLALRARELAERFDRVTYTWVPRAKNAHADRLANEAMDAQAEGHKVVRAGTPAATSAAPPKEDRREPAAQRSPQRWTGASGTPTRLLLLRHAQTPLSIDRRYSGAGDVSLTELGLRQAESAAKRIATMDDLGEQPHVVSSPLTRATQTAQKVADALGVSVETHRELRETDFGEWEGLTFDEAALRDPELHRRWLRNASVRPPGGESFDEVHRRVRRAESDVLARYGGGTVVIVSHVTPIKSLLRSALDTGPSLLYRLHLDLASLSVVDLYPDGNASVRLVNDTCHLN
ncbi:bifunctional RNase H/acid phosphatase [Saccharomonospora xinjiangensis]|uniref:bifunctional RNase H/acid phosphatase n=1 Tax=Saccharomonospora xinjiangensis TaxID=75294 RepID=UPI00106FA10A|nr:bifunctional RNase H/acid phosphatase [Saccharomonospora xinjiangensis]QBQ59169.1 Phosphoserine phosphatase 1 [Saccharomonospora xinjiangensis]